MRRKVPAPRDREARKNSCSLAPDQAGRTRPAGYGQGEGDRDYARLQDQHHQDDDHEVGDADQDLDDTLHDVVHPATVVRGDGPIRHPDNYVQSCCEEGDVQ